MLIIMWLLFKCLIPTLKSSAKYRLSPTYGRLRSRRWRVTCPTSHSWWVAEGRHMSGCQPSKLQGRQALRFSCPLGGSPPAGPWWIPLDSGTHFPPFPLYSVCMKPLWIISDWIVRRPQTKSTDSLLACLGRRECPMGSSLGNSSGYPWTPSFAARGWLDRPQGGAPGTGWAFCILLYLPLSLCHLLPSGLYSPIRGPSWPSPEHA